MERVSARCPIEFDSRLVEDVVMLAEGTLHPLARVRFRRERDDLYREQEPDERDRAFSLFHHRWFERMELGAPLANAVREHHERLSSTRRCLVLPATAARDEDADLRPEVPIDGDEREQRPSVVIRVRATTLVDRAAFERFLDHELMHVADMLDPEFGYGTELPVPEGGPAKARRQQDRYRVLWDCTIDGRLCRAGRLPAEVESWRRADFEHAFPELGPEADAEFRRWFDGPRPEHDELVRVACTGATAARSGICPLCRFPYANLSSPEEMPRGEILESIRADFPAWEPDHGICIACVGLYRARRSACSR